MKTPTLPLWCDMGGTAVFSLGSYYCAPAVAVPIETIEEMITEVVVPEEEPVPPP